MVSLTFSKTSSEAVFTGSASVSFSTTPFLMNSEFDIVFKESCLEF